VVHLFVDLLIRLLVHVLLPCSISDHCPILRMENPFRRLDLELSAQNTGRPEILFLEENCEMHNRPNMQLKLCSISGDPNARGGTLYNSCAKFRPRRFVTWKWKEN
jgi:hypothetical protein